MVEKTHTQLYEDAVNQLTCMKKIAIKIETVKKFLWSYTSQHYNKAEMQLFWTDVWPEIKQNVLPFLYD